MDVTPYVAALREDLLAAAAAGDEQTRRTAALLAAAIEPAARLALLHALSDLTGEVTEALDDGRTVEVRLDGRQVRVAVSEPDRPRADPPPAGPFGATPFGAPFGGDAGDVSRITLRLMEQLKNNAEQAASAQGMSLNSWISQAVQGALSGTRPSGGWDRHGGWDKHRDRQRDRSRRRDGADNPDNRLRGWVQG